MFHGLSPWGYARDNFNLFDGFIVIVSIAELALQNVEGLSSVRALRMFRVFRLLRILGKIEGLRVLMGALSNAAADVTYLLIVPLIFVFMVTHPFSLI